MVRGLIVPDRLRRPRELAFIAVDRAALALGAGDVISEVNGQSIVSVDDYRRAVAKLKAGDNVVFKVLRHSPTDRIMTVFLPGVVPADGK